LESRLLARRNKPLVSTFTIKNASGLTVETTLRVQSIVAEELEDGSIEITFTGYPHGDEGDAELVPNALIAGPARVADAIAERDAARDSGTQLHAITVRLVDKAAARRRPGRSGIPGRWTPYRRINNFIAMQRLIDDGIASGPLRASELLPARPGDHHTILDNYKKHRALIASGNVALLERTIAAYAFALRGRGRVAQDGFAEARKRVSALLTDYTRNRRARQTGE
jgi:hypothetical protein